MKRMEEKIPIQTDRDLRNGSNFVHVKMLRVSKYRKKELPDIFEIAQRPMSHKEMKIDDEFKRYALYWMVFQPLRRKEHRQQRPLIVHTKNDYELIKEISDFIPLLISIAALLISIYK